MDVGDSYLAVPGDDWFECGHHLALVFREEGVMLLEANKKYRFLGCWVIINLFLVPPCLCSCKADARDGRPCTFPGRILFQNVAQKDRVWGNCSLVKTGRTSEAEMLHARDMVQIEDVSDGALPQTTDDDNATVQGAQKYQQAHCLVRFRIGFPKEFGRFSVFHGGSRFPT